MKVESVEIKVLHTDEIEATTSRFGFDEMYRTGQEGDSFLTTLMRSLEEVDKGATVTIQPIIKFDDDYQEAWAGISYTSKLRIRELLREGKKIGAIKLFRSETGWGLKEAKAVIDSEWIWEKTGVLTMCPF